ncbi:hypothetical protein SLE2022_228600 [Rubroshorea leprosula]
MKPTHQSDNLIYQDTTPILYLPQPVNHLADIYKGVSSSSISLSLLFLYIAVGVELIWDLPESGRKYQSCVPVSWSVFLAKLKEFVMEEEGSEKDEASVPVNEEEDAAQNDIAQEESLIPVPEKVPAAAPEKSSSPIDKDVVLAKLATEKRNALVKAWEENEKAKADNKAHKKICATGSWEKSKIASVEAELKKIEEELEKKKAEYAEKMKNKIAEMHKEAEEKRAMVEVKRREDFHKIGETAQKFRATGYAPKKFLGCFGY